MQLSRLREAKIELAGAESFAPALRRFFAKRTPPDEVEDLVQEVMVRMQGRAREEGILNLQGYLFAVAANVLKECHRKANRLPIAEGVSPDGIETITPERIVAGRLNVARVLQAIDLLPVRTREIFVAHRFEGMTYGAIAKLYRVSESAVEKHIMIALRSLTATLKGVGE